MHVLAAGLATFDVVHLLSAEPSTRAKARSIAHQTAAGGPATNGAVTAAALSRLAGGAAEPGADAAAGGDTITLLTALGAGPIADLLRDELATLGVTVLDATDPAGGEAEPAIASIVEHPEGRFAASTHAQVPVDAALGEHLAADAIARAGEPDAVLVDGHNPELAAIALRHGVGRRVLDGGSWKEPFAPLLAQVDVAAVSADFASPVPLADYGITTVIRTDGPHPVRWQRGGRSGQVPVPQVPALSTMGAGDVFHGALTWSLARGSDLLGAIELASHVAALSTRTFGTRDWMRDPGLPALLPR